MRDDPDEVDGVTGRLEREREREERRWATRRDGRLPPGRLRYGGAPRRHQQLTPDDWCIQVPEKEASKQWPANDWQLEIINK